METANRITDNIIENQGSTEVFISALSLKPNQTIQEFSYVFPGHNFHYIFSGNPNSINKLKNDFYIYGFDMFD
jgi:hypothetical protein